MAVPSLQCPQTRVSGPLRQMPVPVSSDSGPWERHHLSSPTSEATGKDLLYAVPGCPAPWWPTRCPPRPKSILGSFVEFSDPVVLPPVKLPLGGGRPPHVSGLRDRVWLHDPQATGCLTNRPAQAR